MIDVVATGSGGKMIDRLGASRRLASLATVVALTFASLANAQNPPGQPAGTSAFAAMTINEAMDFALGDQPMDPTRLALGQHYYASMGFDSSMRTMLDEEFAPVRAGMVARFPGQSKFEVKALAAVDEAIGEMKTAMLDQIRLASARYYAAALTTEQLTELDGFHETPVGRKLVEAPDTVTPAEAQEVRAYFIAHPRLPQPENLYLGVGKVIKTVMDREKVAPNQTFQARLCRAGKKHGLNAGDCSKL